MIGKEEAHAEVARNKTTENELNTTLEGSLATSDHYKKHKRVKLKHAAVSLCSLIPFFASFPFAIFEFGEEQSSDGPSCHVTGHHSLGNYRLITFGRTLGVQLPNTDYNRSSTSLLTTLLVYSPPHER
ncbi:hypothetical protein BcDW1_10658 [Botrytis cinerea BcDW1]|uniref:Uncharacterized protein n=1 Tax=Botryotinia fuckeliana (strain BcDW1) TaxID=1290391 RepID=M7TBJ4_BOTF1|nr:hypothetical protein BcDW1_10658 [Botrytis cinerea BcDW1]